MALSFRGVSAVVDVGVSAVVGVGVSAVVGVGVGMDELMTAVALVTALVLGMASGKRD